MRVGVNIHFGHFGGLSNKNMTKRQRECGIRLFFFSYSGTPQDCLFSLTSPWDFQSPFRVYHWKRALGIRGLVDGYCF